MKILCNVTVSLVLISLVAINQTSAKKSLFKRINTCGSPNLAKSLVINGSEFSRGDYPWMVVLMKIEYLKPLTYRCGGTLISLEHILTGETNSMFC